MKNKKHRILFVDDEELNLILFKNSFHREFNISTAISGAEGLKLLKKENINLIITDQRMPGMTGVEFLEKTLKNYPKLKRILITGYTDYDAVLKAINSGKIYHFFEKPWNETKLRNIINKALDTFQLAIDKENLTIALREKNIILEKSEKKFKGLLESAPDAMVISNNKGEIELINAQAEKLFGYIRSELIKEKVELLIPKEFRKGYPSLRKKYVKTPNARYMGSGNELKAMKKNGDVFPVEISLSPLKTNEGMFTSVAIRDITKRKEAENEIIRLNSELMTLDEAKNEFLRLLNHEIRTPLNGILGGISLLEDYGFTEETKKFFYMLSKSANRLEVFSYKALTISELRTKGRSCLILNEEDLVSIITSAINFHESRLNNKDITIKLSAAENLNKIMVDRKKVEDVFIYLLSNAIKFSETGSKVEIKVLKNDNFLSCQIKDHGKGFSDDAIKNLFKPFSNVKEHVDSNMGLSLYFVKLVMDAQLGDITVKKLKKGSLITLRFSQ